MGVNRNASKRILDAFRAKAPSEHHEQCEVVKHLRTAKIRFCAIPNAGKRPRGQGARMVAEGLEAGVPDLLIFDPPPNLKGRKGVAIEMKAIDGKKPSDEQFHWLSSLVALGWETKIAFGAQEALSWLNSLGYRVPG